MFRSAVLRLTLWYLAILMLLSVCFSMALYRVSVNELDADDYRQTMLLRRNFYLEQMPGYRAFEQARQAQQQQSRRHVAVNLLYFNLIILGAGGAAAYLLALHTLIPIEEAHEAQNRFTADASHELRTPLTAMRTELEVALRDSSLNLAQSKELHHSTLEEIGKLESLSQSLLRLAKHDTTDIRKSFAPVSVRAIVEEAVKQVSPQAKAKSITIAAEVSDLKLIGERWSLVELMTILLDNAVKYSSEHTDITVRSAKVHHGQHVTLSVQDQGPGIAPTDLPHIFDRFYRADRARTGGEASGYGLGLSIAKSIADLHHGSLEVTSSLGKGTAFTATLPIQPNRKSGYFTY